jgi:4-aminobutyrate aminotransferase
MKNAEINLRRREATPRGVGVMCNFYADRAENSTIWDVEGRMYTDFAAGIAVLNTGHRHPAVISAISSQLERFTHTAYQVVPYESYIALAERVNALTPIDGPKKTAFFTTGVEAVENAVKIARAFTGRPGVVAFSGGFHGRTLMGLALTGKISPYKLEFGPFPGEVYHVPFPGELQGITVDDSMKALEVLFKADIDALRVAAIIIEPVQGEGGFNVAPSELMVRLRDICDEHGILLIADEVQTGFGRTGKMFAMEHYPVQADIITMAKSLAGGMPLSAVCGRATVMDAPADGGLGGTYAGNPLAIAAAHAVIDTIHDESLLDRADELGARLREFLGQIRTNNPSIAQIRGLGSMNAVEFVDPVTRKPSATIAQRVQHLALENGPLLLTCGMYGNVIRFLYPLTIPDAQFEQALITLDHVLKKEVVLSVAA